MSATISRETRICRADQLECAEIEAEFAELEARGVRTVCVRRASPTSACKLQRIANFKYYGGFEAVPLSVVIEGRPFDEAALAAALARFAAEHEREYNYVLDEVPVELQLIRLVAYGLIERPSLRQSDTRGTAAAAESGRRDVYFEEENGFVFDAGLRPGETLAGRAAHGARDRRADGFDRAHPAWHERGRRPVLQSHPRYGQSPVGRPNPLREG